VEEPKDYANGAVNNIDDKRKSDGEVMQKVNLFKKV
jgi:hypothetical protein